MNTIATVAGLLLLGFFASLGHPAGNTAAPFRWLGMAFPGVLAMSACVLIETALNGVFEPIGIPFWMLAVFVAPIIEELARGTAILATAPLSPGEAVWMSGWMGVIETLLKAWFQPMGVGVHVFRVLLVVPLHGLLGGILRRGFAYLPLTMIIHFCFNSGIFIGGVGGMLISPMAAAIAFLAWVLATERSGEKNNSPA